MRIGVHFYTKDRYLSGVERYALELVRALSTHVPDNQYVVLTPQPEIVIGYLGAVAGLEIMPVQYPSWRACRIAWEHLRLPAVADRMQLDVLHCPCYVCPVRRSRMPYVVTVHDTLALDHPEWCQWMNARYYGLVLGAALRQATSVVAVSAHTQANVCRRFPAQSDKVRVVHPSLDAAFFQRKGHEELERIRRRYYLPDRYVLSVGNIEPKKNLRLLLEAHSLAARKGLAHPLVLVGRRTWKTNQEWRQIAHGQATGSIRITGYVDKADLPGVYQMADAYVCTSLEEGFGYPPLEAMASGVPVISSLRGALGETVGQAAHAIDPMDADQISEAILRVVSDQGLRQDYMDRGNAHARRFSGQEAAQRLQSVYLEARSSFASAGRY